MVSESFIFVDHTGHSASVLRDSAVYLRKKNFFNMTPKRRQNKKDFHGVSRYFRTFKVPTKADAGKPSFIWTQWTWKPSPRSIGYDVDENGQSRQVQHSIPIHLCSAEKGPVLKRIRLLSTSIG